MSLKQFRNGTGIPYVHVYVCMGNTDAVTCVSMIETALVIKLSVG